MDGEVGRNIEDVPRPVSIESTHGVGVPTEQTRIVICGGGASAALLTLALTHGTDRSLQITIVERKDKVGPGLAYATSCTSHLLNVRAGRMSVDSGDADHFVHWLNRRCPRANSPWQRENYVQRSLYGLYLQEVVGGLIISIRGRLGRAELDSGGNVLRAEVRSKGQHRYLLVNRIVNCTGLRRDPRGSDNALLKSIMKSGIVRPDVLNLGLDVDKQARLIADDGRVHQSLFALGPLTRGRWWEVVAIPEIRARAVQLARTILEHARP
jgi:uncharacterized NAD(P)/FAD-binding protein YdhS